MIMAKKKDSILAIILERGADITARFLNKTAEILSDEDNQKKAKEVANDLSEQTTDAAKFIKKKIETIKDKKPETGKNTSKPAQRKVVKVPVQKAPTKKISAAKITSPATSTKSDKSSK